MNNRTCSEISQSALPRSFVIFSLFDVLKISQNNGFAEITWPFGSLMAAARPVLFICLSIFLRMFERNKDWALPYKTRMVQHIITLKAAERIPKAMKLDEKAKLKHQAARPTKMSISQLGAWIVPIPLGL